MATFELSTLNLPPEVERAIHDIATDLGISEADYLREHLSHSIHELEEMRRKTREGLDDLDAGECQLVKSEKCRYALDQIKQGMRRDCHS